MTLSVTSLAPSLVVPTPGTVYHHLVDGMDDPRGEPAELMAKAALLLATEPLDTVTGRVTYSQQILREFGWIDSSRGTGTDRPRPHIDASSIAFPISFMSGKTSSLQCFSRISPFSRLDPSDTSFCEPRRH